MRRAWLVLGVLTALSAPGTAPAAAIVFPQGFDTTFDAAKAEAIHRLLTKAATLLDAADGILTGATTSGLVSPQCAIDLGAYLLELRQCVFGLPHE